MRFCRRCSTLTLRCCLSIGRKRPRLRTTLYSITRRSRPSGTGWSSSSPSIPPSWCRTRHVPPVWRHILPVRRHISPAWRHVLPVWRRKASVDITSHLTSLYLTCRSVMVPYTSRLTCVTSYLTCMTSWGYISPGWRHASPDVVISHLSVRSWCRTTRRSGPRRWPTSRCWSSTASSTSSFSSTSSSISTRPSSSRISDSHVLRWTQRRDRLRPEDHSRQLPQELDLCLPPELKLGTTSTALIYRSNYLKSWCLDHHLNKDLVLTTSSRTW